MSTRPRDGIEKYVDYEAALVSLQAIPDKLAQGFANAQHASDDARKAADLSFQQQNARLTSLLNNAQSRFNSAVNSLKEHSVLLPSQVRAEDGTEGDERALKRAVDAHVAAVATVDAQLREAMAAAGRAKDDATRRAGVAQKAVDALQARQDKLRREQEAANQAARITAHKATVRRRRILFGMCFGGAMMALVIVITIFSLNT